MTVRRHRSKPVLYPAQLARINQAVARVPEHLRNSFVLKVTSKLNLSGTPHVNDALLGHVIHVALEELQVVP